ncbi:RHS repeat-associated core domain-containing protein [Streptomyces sp. NPDC058955]|uniref:RHS repeat-associated core domain-containing protein n=1 Tax=unclassified Streptomyces TaxID=2593676 RepID=UPI0036563B3F
MSLVLLLSATSIQQVSFAADQRTKRPDVQDMGDPVVGKDAPASKRPNPPGRTPTVTKLDRATWPTQAHAEVNVAAAGEKKSAAKAGALPISAQAPQQSAAAAASRLTAPHEIPEKIGIDVLDPKRAAALGAAAVFGVERSDGGAKPAKVRLNVDYATFSEGFGGSYASRLNLVQLPACAAMASPGSEKCPEQPKILPTRNDTTTSTLSADVTVAPDSSGMSTMNTGDVSLFAVAAGPSSAQGDYKATPLAPSANWTVSASSGGFSWNYPLRTVPTPGGLTPSLGLSYTSQSADGRTSATNNQGSWIGEGFSYEPGYIERRYKPCAQDGHTGSGEQCWAYDNATVMLEGQSSQLVKDTTTKKWHLSNDSGATVDKLVDTENADDNNEYWRIITSNGTEYYFGLNRLPGWQTGNEETRSVWTAPVFGDDSGEPCYNTTFANAHCNQAWRWSLDYVKDTHGNVMSYFYQPETNYYALNGKTDVNGTAYHRGGFLKRIDYGQRDGQVYAGKAPARVTFILPERCLPDASFDCAESKRSKANAAYWPDTPVDQECKANTPCTVGQTFWTTKRVGTINTQMLKDATTYQDVDRWNLTHTFTDNGDTSKALWLSKIHHEGRAGTPVQLPEVELFSEEFRNRVDAVGDNTAAFYRPRLAMVLSDTGAQLDINYAAPECDASALPTPGASTKRCYPVVWAPPGKIDPETDWFHKYVVAEIIQTDRTGGSDSLVTRYNYGNGKGAWRKSKPDGITDTKFLTWSNWQGYDKVTVTSGTADRQTTRVDYRYLQGMDGDTDSAGGTRSIEVSDSKNTTYTDAEEFAGHELESFTYDGSQLVSHTISEPWKHVTATFSPTWGKTYAAIVKPRTTRAFSLLSNDTWRETKTVPTFDTATGTGRTTQIDGLGDVSTTADDTCTRLWYADNLGENILSLPSRSEVVTVNCATTPDRKTQVLTDERTFYDAGVFDAAPTKGDVTQTQRLTAHDGTTATYQTTGTSGYDAYGRILWQKDAKLNETKTAYTQVNGLATQATVTNALGHITTTDYAPAWGQPTGQTDPNNKRTDLARDALGRITSVWLPDRLKIQAPSSPSIKYTYNQRKDKPTWIRTEKLKNDGTYGSEYELYDSLLRGRQIQTQGVDGTRLVADTWYNGTGKVKKTNATYSAAGAPSGELHELTTGANGAVGAQNRFEYDGLGRITAEIFDVSGDEQWRTTTTYDGEKTTVDPPTGGRATTTVTNAEGRTTSLFHYQGDRPDPALGTPDETKYTYTRNGQLESVTDAQGNVWRYEYDQLGRKTKTVDPDAGTSRTEYDELDRPVASYDGRNKKVSTQYDKLSRPTLTWEGDPTTGTKLTETLYDTPGRLGMAYSTRRYTSPTEYFATTIQVVDSLYRPLRTGYTIPASQGALAGLYVYDNTYNTDGTLQGTSLPAAGGLPAEPLVTEYDTLQRPTTLTGATSYVTNTIYSSRSHMQQLELHDGSGKKVWNTYQYEKGTDRLTQASTDVYLASSTAKQSNYSYDQAGNVLSISDVSGPVSNDVQCFRYDGRQSLTHAWTPAATDADATGSGTVGTRVTVTGSMPKACEAAPGTTPLGGPAPYWKEYRVDSIGNRTSEAIHDISLDETKDITRTYTYGTGIQGADPHQVTRVLEKTPTGDRQSTYEYDASGNTTKRVIAGDTQSITWDATGKPTSVTSVAGQTTFLYDAEGNRIVRKDPSTTTLYLPGMELSVTNGSSTVKGTRYYTHAGQTVAVRTSDGKLSFLASDHHGTSDVAIDSTTGAVTQRRFDPYGLNRGTPSGPWIGDKGFVGGTTDASTGLTHLGAREYDPQLGKFISVDPIIDYSRPQQINGYAYASNSPVTRSDPSGLFDFISTIVSGVKQAAADVIEAATQGLIPAEEEKDPAVQEAEEEKEAAEGQYDRATQKIQKAAEEVATIVADELGIPAALDCLTTGNLGSCGESILNIAGSFAGGIAGKVLAKYGMPWNWEKGAELAMRITGLVDEIIEGAFDWMKASKAVTKAEKALEAAKARVSKSRSGGCPTEGAHSFLPGTKVLAADGAPKAIEKVEPGDKLTVTDPETDETTVRVVAGTIVTEDDKHFVTLTIKRSSTGGEEQLASTTTHPFWVVSANAWIEAGDLEPGMTLRTPSGETVVLAALTRYDKRQRTHDLTLTDVHTYYVLAGGTPVLVHNCDLSNRASEIHAAEPDEYIRDNISTVAVVRVQTPHGQVDLIAGSGDGLTPAQMSVPLNSGEMHVPNIPGTHAEQNALLYARAFGYTPISGGASRNVCRKICHPSIRMDGGKMVGNVFPGNGVKTTRQRSFEW